METSEELYRHAIRNAERLDEGAFEVALLRCRDGDDGARRQISESYLYLALEVAEQKVIKLQGAQLLSVVQEANAALVDAIQAFNGRTASEFEAFARRVITTSLEQVDFGSA